MNHYASQWPDLDQLIGVCFTEDLLLTFPADDIRESARMSLADYMVHQPRHQIESAQKQLQALLNRDYSDEKLAEIMFKMYCRWDFRPWQPWLQSNLDQINVFLGPQQRPVPPPPRPRNPAPPIAEQPSPRSHSFHSPPPPRQNSAWWFVFGAALLVIVGGIWFANTNLTATPASSPGNIVLPTWPTDSLEMVATNYIPSISAHVQQLTFFESDRTAPDKGARVYAADFHGASDRFIYCELTLTHPRRAVRQDFTMVSYVYDSTGSRRVQAQWSSYLNPEWDNSYHTSSLLGPTDAWQSGMYRVSIFADGIKIASGSFTIDHLPTEAQLAERHQEAVTKIELAQQLYEQRDYKSAVAACDSALGIEPGNTDATRLKEEIGRTMAILEIQ